MTTEQIVAHRLVVFALEARALSTASAQSRADLKIAGTGTTAATVAIGMTALIMDTIVVGMRITITSALSLRAMDRP